ncbi:MAG TPA: membrane protein insertase YidC [Alphaproteobacteria bacterium]|nr:membrane protein insertase YidC [Alphaproteobacteria bacterium]
MNNNNENNSNLVIAVVLSALIMVGFQYFYVKPHQEQYRQQVLAEKQTQAAPKPENAAAAVENAVPRDRADVIKETARIAISTPQLHGSIDLKGARIDDIELAQYRETTDPKSPNIVLLSPSGSADPHTPYYVEFNWLGDANTPVPSSQTEWKSDNKTLSPDHPVKLTWDNGKGLNFTRTISVDDEFMFTIADSVKNSSNAPVTLYPFGLIARQGNPVAKSVSVLHEGPLAVLGGTLNEYKYKKLMEEGKQTGDSEGGWLGVTDKYWLVAMVPQQDEKISASFAYNASGDPTLNHGWFQSDYRGAPVTIAAGATAEQTEHLFTGAKRINLIDHYAKEFNIPHFDRAIDFGWFYFLTKPFLYLLAFLGNWFGSLGIAILVFTVLLKLITLPLSLKSYHSMARMKKLQPEIKRIQERYADDKIKQNQEMMEYYKREKVNPLAGCLPQLIQIPIFFALYKVLYVGIELRQAPFYGWIRDMSVPDPTSWTNIFGLASWGVPHQLVVNLGLFTLYLPPAVQIGAWPILMGCSMFLQQRMSPQPPDKSQARLFMFMPLFLTYILSSMASGLVIYWTWSNLLSIAQQAYIMRSDANKKA